VLGKALKRGVLTLRQKKLGSLRRVMVNFIKMAKRKSLETTEKKTWSRGKIPNKSGGGKDWQ